MRVPTRIAAFWGLGAFATTTMLNGVSIVLLFFLVNFVKIEPVVAGGLLFASKLSSADQSAGADQAMLIGFMWIPVGTQLLAMLLLYWYRLDKQDLHPGPIDRSS